ncbi:MAG: MBL fold metallo-hydrolase [Synergistaceae bacterium]|nr:MBL fold metallo-hydrolase [Synergistaceae bacterium]
MKDLINYIKRTVCKRGCFPICAALILFFSPIVFAGEIELHVIDVGQGESMLFKLPAGEIILIDGGPTDAGERVVSYLKRSGVKKIDLLIATHPHEDHMGGLLSVLDSFPVTKVWDSGHNLGSATQRKFLERVKKSGAKFEIARAGFTQKIGDVFIRVFAPVNSHRKSDDANKSSIVTHISWKKMSFLLMGDAEHKERRIIDSYPHSVVLKLAHHGSRNGTIKSLLQKIKPRMAVVSCGRDNSYGHPHKEVLKLLDEFKIKLYSTVEGNIIIKSNGENFSVNYAAPDEQSVMDVVKSVLDIFFKW